MKKRILGRNTGTANRFPTLLGLLATVVGTSMISAPIARANFFDKLKQATNALKDVKKTANKKTASKSGVSTKQQNAAAQQSAPKQPAGTATFTQKAVGPLMQKDNAYTVSMHGGHFATVNMHGSRFVVTVDGVDGPRVNAILLSHPAPNGGGLEAGVAMSDDGNHTAYVARVGHNVVVFADGKQLLQFPENGIGSPFGLFFSPHGDHLFFTAPGQYQHEENVWIDGKPAMTLDTSATAQIVFSADGHHYLYVGHPDPASRKRAMIVDGKDAHYPVDGIENGDAIGPRFTADGQHVICVTNDAPPGSFNVHVRFDGKPVITSSNLVVQVVTAPEGDSYAVVVADSAGGGYNQYQVYLNGKEVPGASYNNENTSTAPVVKFSPDGKHLAIACNTGDGNAYVLRDGKKGDAYDKIESGQWNSQAAMQFSADSTSFGYFGMVGNTKAFAVINGNEVDTGFALGSTIRFSPEGHHVAVIGLPPGGGLNSAVLYVDGKQAFTGLLAVNSFIFNRDGSHWVVMDEGKSQSDTGIFFDGKKLPFTGLEPSSYRFSPDGSELLVRGSIPHQGWGLYLYNCATNRIMHIANIAHAQTLEDPVFSPDGKHLYYAASFGRVQHGFGSTFKNELIYVDGQKTAAEFQNSYFLQFSSRPASKAATWQVGPDDKLRAVRVANGKVTLFTVTPPAGGIAALW